jgi:hypothetical protein
MAFSFLLNQVTSCELNIWKGFDAIILLCPATFISRFDYPPTWSCPPNVQFGFGDEAMWRKVWQWVFFMQNFWNFKAIPDIEIILISIQNKLVLTKFKWFLWRGSWSDESFLSCFWVKDEVTSGWSQKV